MLCYYYQKHYEPISLDVVWTQTASKEQMWSWKHNRKLTTQGAGPTSGFCILTGPIVHCSQSLIFLLLVYSRSIHLPALHVFNYSILNWPATDCWVPSPHEKPCFFVVSINLAPLNFSSLSLYKMKIYVRGTKKKLFHFYKYPWFDIQTALLLISLKATSRETQPRLSYTA